MIITDNQLGSVNRSTPKVIVIETTPTPVARGKATNVVAIVGQFERGEPNKVYKVGSLSASYKVLGGYKLNSSNQALDGHLALKNLYNSQASVVKVVRVADSAGTVKATVTIDDGQVTPADVFSITADTVGTWGNSITVQTEAHPTATYFNMTVRNTVTQEKRVYTKVSTLSTDSRYVKTIVDNDPLRFFNIAMVLTDGTEPDYDTFSLTTGANGTTSGTGLASSAYVGVSSPSKTGLQVFSGVEHSDINIVISARNDATINTGLITHVDTLGMSPRRTIITFASGTSVSTAVTNKATITSSRVKIVYDWLYVENPYTGAMELNNPVTFSAGIDSVLGYWQSASQQKLPATVKGTEFGLDQTEINTLTEAQINPIVFDQDRGYIFASDYTCSDNEKEKQNVVRKGKDFFAKAFDSGIKPFVSKPIIANGKDNTFNKVKEALESLLRMEASAGHIGRHDGAIPYEVKCDTENNTDDTVQNNTVRVDAQISLLAPADIIEIYVDAQQNKTIVSV